MNDFQQHNILWLASAITHPLHHTKRQHYYDGTLKMLFTRVRLDYCGAKYEVRNSADHIMPEEIASDLLVRLELIDDASSKIVEIPKLNVDDKIAIQTLFLNAFEGVCYYNELSGAVKAQQDDHRFVLDTVLVENENAAPMAPYWNDYKVRTVMEYLSTFASLIDIHL